MAEIRELTETEKWLAGLDPKSTPARDAHFLWHIRTAADAFEAARSAVDDTRTQLDTAVAAARAHGDSWGLIGMVLGVSRQAAQQRFGHLDESARRPVTQRITAKDIEAGRIRVPAAGKPLFPDERADLDLLLNGEQFRARWDPRNGPDRPRSGVLSFGRGLLARVVQEDDVLGIGVSTSGTELTRRNQD